MNERKRGMNIKSGIRYGALTLLLSGCFFQSCQQDVLDGVEYDKDTLIAQGRYLTARSADAFAIQDPTVGPQPFAAGTPYRLLAFAKRYNASAPTAETPIAETLRFNKVAWEEETEGGLRYMNVDSDPDRWFGFSALGDETPGDKGLVSLDFYGFTYGVAEAAADNYISLDGMEGKTTRPASLTRTESVAGGELKDLMRGVLLNQNISTAGVARTEADGFQVPEDHTQSVIPFTHCFSKLSFQVSQQTKDDEKDADGNPVLCFENLVVEKIEVTGTYQTGVVSLADGRVNVSGPLDRTLTFDDKFTGEVTDINTNAGEMVLFPSDGSALSNSDLADGYTVGLNIAIKSTVRGDIENMLANTESPVVITEETGADGKQWYKGTIVKNEIVNYFLDKDAPDRVLYFKQNTSYMLVITFHKDSVRIITVIPQVEEWLPGEGTATDPWQDQAMGQPQMFDNIVWSDRNLGAEHFDPTGDEYEKCVGYFYQSGRNIPYYPFQYGNYSSEVKPDLKDIRKQDLANASSSYNISKFRFYPVVDPSILRMTGSTDWVMNKNLTPQMDIPESRPDAYFNFLKGEGSSPGSGLQPQHDMHWERGNSNQPVGGVWSVPSSQEYLTVFPSTPHAGNLTFRVGGFNDDPMNWNPGAMGDNVEVLRVTVPYYYSGMSAPGKSEASEKYTDAWNWLKKGNDEGCTSEGYVTSPGNSRNVNVEPDGDPEDGYASAYVISRVGDDKVVPEILRGNDSQGKAWTIKSWGTIYAIKRIYTPEAYRMRWRVINSTKSAINPCFYIEICRYRCSEDSKLSVHPDSVGYYKSYDWDHPAATIYFPICGLGDWTGQYINFGTECQYATSNAIDSNGKTSAVQIKVSGNDAYNAYIAVVNGVINRNFGKQIRPIVRRRSYDTQ